MTVLFRGFGSWRHGALWLLRPILTTAGLLALWEAVIRLTSVPPFILPAPRRVLETWWQEMSLLLHHGGITAAEIALGLVVGVGLGFLSGLILAGIPRIGRWLLPLLVVSQALPVFALAPLLVLWFGYGMASKVAMATLILYFPVTIAFFDGLRRTEPGWLDLASTMKGGHWAVLWHIRLPAALPALASGVRIAAAVAPIGAVVGEWVGSSAGLGYLMLHANARMRTDLMFAALFTLAVMALLLYFLVDVLVRRALPWVPESRPLG